VKGRKHLGNLECGSYVMLCYVNYYVDLFTLVSVDIPFFSFDVYRIFC
jgi:hypothetical protein